MATTLAKEKAFEFTLNLKIDDCERKIAEHRDRIQVIHQRMGTCIKEEDYNTVTSYSNELIKLTTTIRILEEKKKSLKEARKTFKESFKNEEVE